MEDSHDFDPLVENRVNSDIRSACDNEFASTLHPAGFAERRVSLQAGQLMLDLVALFDGCPRVILGDVIDNRIEITLSGGKPQKDQDFSSRGATDRDFRFSAQRERISS